MNETATAELEPTAQAAMDPERAAFVQAAITRTAAWLLDWALHDLQASTASSTSSQDRLLSMALRPWMPKLRDIALGRLATADPAALERLMTATSTALGSILDQAPGAPLPRMVLGAGADGRPTLDPDPRDVPA